MLETIASNIDSFVAVAPTWGFVLIFVFMAIESSFIPFPSEVVMIPAGFLAARGELGPFSPWIGVVLSVIVGTLGSLLGAYVNYYLALWAGKPFLEKYGKYFFIKKEALDRSCAVFNKYGAATTFICRLIPGIRQLISIPAGIAKMPLGSFSLFTSLGAGIWSAILAIVGYALAKTAGDITYRELVLKGADRASAYGPWILGGAVLVVVMYIIVKKILKKRR
ncbi:MAG: DedA family protein [Kiritimatiellae bacterium]|nr:DedA family protein [Kiritimatiellia bacterium]